MTEENSQFVPRPPRHAVAREHRLAVTLRQLVGQSDSDREATPSAVTIEPINLSRCGLQFRAPTALSPGDPLVIEFVAPESDLQIRQEAVVRWQQSESDSMLLTGCQFVEELSWEVLGEFFLLDVLSSEEASPQVS